MFNHYSIIWIIKIFLQIRIRIRIFSPESRIFGFGFENFMTMNKVRIRIRKISGLRIRFEIRICSKKRFVSTLWARRLISGYLDICMLPGECLPERLDLTVRELRQLHHVAGPGTGHQARAGSGLQTAITLSRWLTDYIFRSTVSGTGDVDYTHSDTARG